MSYAPIEPQASPNRLSRRFSETTDYDPELELLRRDLEDDQGVAYHPSSNYRASWRRYWPANAILRPRLLFALVKILVPIGIIMTVIFFLFWELHVEIMWYEKYWVAKEIQAVEPLAGCFEPAAISSSYNLTLAQGPKRMEVQSGLPLRFGLDCYDFAGTIQRDPKWPLPSQTTMYHSYWRSDLAPFSERQEWMLKSFFATQDLTSSKFVLWSNGDLSSNTLIQKWLRRYPQAFELRVAKVEQLARGTELAGSAYLKSTDAKAWTDGDLIRLLLLWNFGGVWIDMDSLLTRDLTPLFEHEFVTQWDCYDKRYQPFNGALMHFLKHSPYLCEAFHIMAVSPPPRPASTDWGSLLYLKLWRRLVAVGVAPFKVLPFCFSDGRSCRMDNRLPDPFQKDPKTWANGLSLQGSGSPLEKTLNKVFAVHLHNQWEKPFAPNGWVQRYLLTKYDKQLQ